MTHRCYSLRFRAMGTQVTLLALGRPGSRAVPRLLEAVRRLFAREEARFSRFRPDSELSRLNRAGGSERPSPEMWDVLIRCRRWWHDTGGLFDPTVLPALESAGYDRPFERLTREGAVPRDQREPCPAPGFGHVRLEEAGLRRRVRLDPGVRLDLGGIVKGWTVDRAAELLAPVGHYLIDAGGDIRARGHGPEPPGWPVGVQDPLLPREDAGLLLLREGAVAFSSVHRRRWRRPGHSPGHHLIDPRTGRPSQTPLVAVAVVASTAEEADVMATAALLMGPMEGRAWVEARPGAAAWLFRRDGAREATAGWPGLAYERLSDVPEAGDYKAGISVLGGR